MGNLLITKPATKIEIKNLINSNSSKSLNTTINQISKIRKSIDKLYVDENGDDEDTSIDEQDDEDKETGKCIFVGCDKIFTFGSIRFANHLILHNSKLDNSKLNCTICGYKGFYRPDTLYRHIRQLHGGFKRRRKRTKVCDIWIYYSSIIFDT